MLFREILDRFLWSTVYIDLLTLGFLLIAVGKGVPIILFCKTAPIRETDVKIGRWTLLIKEM